MAENGIFLVPTVWIYSTRDLYVFKADINYLNELHADTINRARSAGVKIAAGVDCSYADCPPLEGMVNELKVLVACGLSNMEAIESATSRGAELMGWEEYLGSLTPGKLADMVVVDGDPIDDIQNLSRIVLVIQHGQIVANKLEGKAIPDPLPKPSLLPAWMN
jgi:imidazolonepropionase-like amidohydrolase